MADNRRRKGNEKVADVPVPCPPPPQPQNRNRPEPVIGGAPKLVQNVAGTLSGLFIIGVLIIGLGWCVSGSYQRAKLEAETRQKLTVPVLRLACGAEPESTVAMPRPTIADRFGLGRVVIEVPACNGAQTGWVGTPLLNPGERVSYDPWCVPDRTIMEQSYGTHGPTKEYRVTPLVQFGEQGVERAYASGFRWRNTGNRTVTIACDVAVR